MSSRSSRTEGERTPLPDSVVVGFIRKPHGLEGEVLVEVLSDVPDRLTPGRRLQIVDEAGRRRPCTVMASRPHRGLAILRLEGYSRREDVEELRGTALEVPRAEVPPAEPGTYYHFELIGCACFDRRAGAVGTVVELVEDGGGVLLALERDGGRLLVPFVREFLLAVDVPAGRIDLDLPEGLIETCTSTS